MRPLLDQQPVSAIAPPPRWRGLAFLLAISSVYLALLLYVDRDTGVLSRLAELPGSLALCAVLVSGSFAMRYQRWHCLLRVQGYEVHWGEGLRAYVAGFAFTASPGKAGELLRIRYFGNLNVPPQVVLATFIVERGQDLLVITALGVGVSALIPAFGALAMLVAGSLSVLYLATRWPWLLQKMGAIGDRLPFAWGRRLASFLIAGVSGVSPLLRWSVMLPGLVLGGSAWLLIALAFAALCSVLGMHLSWPQALGIYPVAMLAGAASFVPGGVGTTEAAIVLMLTTVGANMDVAVTAAIGIRLASLWLAIVMGMLAMASLEIRPARQCSRSASAATESAFDS
ncbi:lysylphosphatidylglycerol synthase transmembrane domain-containing protein [Stenotrophomonas sp. LMG 10879]|uniref:lysylphosphatidylglycerol synthase transmembrane domain-containing protein n=1 Tax=Stenotrophomonas sp. LMG 10879 TaxID=487706 RepID=UPI001FAEE99E|nr:lysylphosphatidylglycerol synthase transmembrane domain-containing protein [Stenotrophomonas sp. LMG 10879]